MAQDRDFFPMPRKERVALLLLICFAGAAFLMPARNIEFAGMALFGWMMAALMLISPILTLWAVRRVRRRS